VLDIGCACCHQPPIAAPLLQLFTFLLAGYETTSVALSFSLYLLALHPEHQQRVMQVSSALARMTKLLLSTPTAQDCVCLQSNKQPPP
jgi:hypothetical protein